MSEPIVKHQLFDYDEDNPFHIVNIEGPVVYEEYLVNHWHTEMEIVYDVRGYSMRYIDGVCYQAEPDSLVVVNPESIHSIIPDRSVIHQQGVIAIVLIISYDFVKDYFPNIEDNYFIITDKINMSEVKRIMLSISDKAKETVFHSHDIFFLKGLVLELFYYLCQDGYRKRENVLTINHQKNNERLRGVIQYVERHYMEPITQSDTARQFYFTKEYFSRFFKKSTGVNFKEYLTRYRIIKSRQELLNTDHSILEIALNNGFSEERRLINSFKKIYGITPLQYRKKKLQEDGQSPNRYSASLHF